ESLYYEDFDFWIRSSRKYRYCYTPEILVKKRVVKDSMYHQQFRRLSPQLQSTLKVCEKILLLNRTGDERRALNKRIGYEIRVCLRLGAVSLALQYVKLFWRNISGKHRV
ncbi:MAG: glycosyl transferase, partial [Bacteroidota bacterium]